MGGGGCLARARARAGRGGGRGRGWRPQMGWGTGMAGGVPAPAPTSRPCPRRLLQPQTELRFLLIPLDAAFANCKCWNDEGAAAA